jgi:hypothetical protein
MIVLHPSGPYNLNLSLRAAQAFSPDKNADVSILKLVLMIGDRPAVMEIKKEYI